MQYPESSSGLPSCATSVIGRALVCLFWCIEAMMTTGIKSGFQNSIMLATKMLFRVPLSSRFERHRSVLVWVLPQIVIKEFFNLFFGTFWLTFFFDFDFDFVIEIFLFCISWVSFRFYLFLFPTESIFYLSNTCFVFVHVFPFFSFKLLRLCHLLTCCATHLSNSLFIQCLAISPFSSLSSLSVYLFFSSLSISLSLYLSLSLFDVKVLTSFAENVSVAVVVVVTVAVVVVVVAAAAVVAGFQTRWSFFQSASEHPFHNFFLKKQDFNFKNYIPKPFSVAEDCFWWINANDNKLCDVM